MSDKQLPMALDLYPRQVTEKMRFCDTDQLGHINNAVFAMLCESGRVGFLYDPENSLAQPGAHFVIAKLTINFLNEINWPADVIVGTGVARIGRSSFDLHQGLFVNGKCVGTCESVLVLMDAKTRSSRPMPQPLLDELEALNIVKTD